MRTLFKLIGMILFFWLFIQLAYQTGYQRTTDKDFDIGIPEPKPESDTLKFKLLEKDTTPYQGNWMDAN